MCTFLLKKLQYVFAQSPPRRIQHGCGANLCNNFIVIAILKNRDMAILPIQDGCSNRGYCILPIVHPVIAYYIVDNTIRFGKIHGP